MTALQADGDPVSGRHSCLTASAGFGFDMNVKATTVGKDGRSAFSVFQRRLGSVMAFVMNRNFLFSFLRSFSLRLPHAAREMTKALPRPMAESRALPPFRSLPSRQKARARKKVPIWSSRFARVQAW